MIDRPAAVFSDHAARVRVVDHHDAAELLRKIAQRGQRAEVAVHAEDAVGDEELALRGGQRLQNRPRGVAVFVRKDLDGWAGGRSPARPAPPPGAFWGGGGGGARGAWGGGPPPGVLGGEGGAFF